MIPSHPFGRTGHTSTRTLFGAAALGSVTQAEADHTLDLIFRRGYRFISHFFAIQHRTDRGVTNRDVIC